LPLLQGSRYTLNHPGDDTFLLGLELFCEVDVSVLLVELIVELNYDKAPPEAAGLVSCSGQLICAEDVASSRPELERVLAYVPRGHDIPGDDGLKHTAGNDFV